MTPFARPLAWHPNGEILAAGCYPQDGIVLWDISSGAKMQTLAHPMCELRLEFNAFGDLLAGNSFWEGKLTLWDVSSGQVELIHNGSTQVDMHADCEGNLECLSFQAPRQFVPQVIEHSRALRTLARPRFASTAAFADLSFSPDGRLLAVASDGVIQFHQTSNWTMIGEVVAGPCFLNFDDSGSLLTWNELGLNKWPMSTAEPSEVSMHQVVAQTVFGPPLPLLKAPAFSAFDVDGQDRWIAIPHRQGAQVCALRIRSIPGCTERTGTSAPFPFAGTAGCSPPADGKAAMPRYGTCQRVS